MVVREIGRSDVEIVSKEAPRDLDRPDDEAWRFLRGLASSPTFARRYWQRRPIHLSRDDVGSSSWIPKIFGMDDLRLVDRSYVSGHRTADVLRNGTQTDTWRFAPLKADPTKPTTWDEVREALEGGTIYFNTAGGLWPSLGSLCLLSNAAFGLPSNVNIYVTPPHVDLSVPPHTDRQDVLVFQTAGVKRWRVYRPPQRKKGVDPLNRGKAGDVLSIPEELSDKLEMDVVLRPGDVLYVPAGFPHTTDTCGPSSPSSSSTSSTKIDSEADDANERTETSVHLTMGLDTHVWGLTYAHLRWSLLQRVGKDFNLNIESDERYWDAMRTMIPVGDPSFPATKDSAVDAAALDAVSDELRDVILRLEPHRWTTGDEEEDKSATTTTPPATERETLPTRAEFREVVSYMIHEHLRQLLAIQDDMFRKVNPHDENTIMNTYYSTQKQSKIMENFGKFSKNSAMAQQFQQMREKKTTVVETAKAALSNQQK